MALDVIVTLVCTSVEGTVEYRCSPADAPRVGDKASVAVALV
jgi:hypothetical protein